VQSLDAALQPEDEVIKSAFFSWTSAIPYLTNTVPQTGLLPATMLVCILHHFLYAFSSVS